jgi:hypothetical protein
MPVPPEKILHLKYCFQQVNMCPNLHYVGCYCDDKLSVGKPLLLGPFYEQEMTVLSHEHYENNQSAKK